MQRTMLKSGLDGFALPALHAKPLHTQPMGKTRGSVVVIQEIFGLTDHIGDMCALFAADGYETMAPGLFERIEPGFHAEVDAAGIAKGRDAVMATPWAQVAADVQAALDALPEPRFVTGFCWGGAASWIAAARCSGVNAVSCFYGRLIADLVDETPRVPVMLHYGARDASIPPENIERVRAAAPGSPLYVYDAGHGFCRQASHDYNEAASTLALTRTLDWFARWR